MDPLITMVVVSIISLRVILNPPNMGLRIYLLANVANPYLYISIVYIFCQVYIINKRCLIRAPYMYFENRSPVLAFILA